MKSAGVWGLAADLKTTHARDRLCHLRYTRAASQLNGECEAPPHPTAQAAAAATQPSEPAAPASRAESPAPRPVPAFGGPCWQFGSKCRMWEVVDFTTGKAGASYVRHRSSCAPLHGNAHNALIMLTNTQSPQECTLSSGRTRTVCALHFQPSGEGQTRCICCACSLAPVAVNSQHLQRRTYTLTTHARTCRYVLSDELDPGALRLGPEFNDISAGGTSAVDTLLTGRCARSLF